MSDGIRGRVGDDLHRVRGMLERSFDDDHTTREVAGSFSLGVFITMLPTLGVGFLVFVALAFFFDRLSKVALVASAVVFNPVVKWGVYGASFTLGTALLGPAPGASIAQPSLTAAPGVVVRLVLGNAVLAVLAAVPSYFVARHVVERYGGSAGSYYARLRARLGRGRPRADGGVDESESDSEGPGA